MDAQPSPDGEAKGTPPAEDTESATVGRASGEHDHAGVRAALKFVGRVSLLEAATLRAVVTAWHDVMRSKSDAWFAAERATAEAIVATERATDQDALIGHLSDHFLRRVWSRSAAGHQSGAPERRVGATEASGQYVATVAMLALLVRDRLNQADFAVLYRPFADVIRTEELRRE